MNAATSHQQYLLNESKMYNPKSKSSLVKFLEKGRGVVETELPPVDVSKKTAVVVDAMHLIRKWSFKKGDKYEHIADSYKEKLLSEVPEVTTSIHFCCNRYQDDSLKASERMERYSGKLLREYEVRDGFTAPDPDEFFPVSKNKANLLQYLCNTWSNEPMQQGIILYLSGGFQKCEETLKVSHEDIEPIPLLESTHEEADQHIILHTIFIAEHEDVQRTVIFCNDTDVICLALYYASSWGLRNVWIRKDQSIYMSITKLASCLGNYSCRLLPFLHSIGGRDTTSFFYGVGKAAWVKCAKEVKLEALLTLGEDVFEVTDEIMHESKQLLSMVYGGKLNSNIAQL